MRLPTATANTSATVVTASKYSSALPPTRPTFLKLPMPALTDEPVRPSTRAIKHNVRRRNMPPSHSDANIGMDQFSNSAALIDAEERNSIQQGWRKGFRG